MTLHMLCVYELCCVCVCVCVYVCVCQSYRMVGNGTLKQSRPAKNIVCVSGRVNECLRHGNLTSAFISKGIELV